MNNKAKIKQSIFVDTVVTNFLKNSLNAVYKQWSYATRVVNILIYFYVNLIEKMELNYFFIWDRTPMAFKTFCLTSYTFCPQLTVYSNDLGQQVVRATRMLMMTVKIFRSVIVNGLYFLYYDFSLMLFIWFVLEKKNLIAKGKKEV